MIQEAEGYKAGIRRQRPTVKPTASTSSTTSTRLGPACDPRADVPRNDGARDWAVQTRSSSMARRGTVPILPLDQLRGRQTAAAGAMAMQRTVVIMRASLPPPSSSSWRNAFYIVPVDQQALVLRFGRVPVRPSTPTRPSARPACYSQDSGRRERRSAYDKRQHGLRPAGRRDHRRRPAAPRTSTPSRAGASRIRLCSSAAPPRIAIRN